MRFLSEQNNDQKNQIESLTEEIRILQSNLHRERSAREIETTKFTALHVENQIRDNTTLQTTQWLEQQRIESEHILRQELIEEKARYKRQEEAKQIAQDNLLKRSEEHTTKVESLILQRKEME